MLFLRRLLGSARSIQPPMARFYSRHPLASNCVIYGSLYAGAELSQQTINHVFTSKRRSSSRNNTVASANANTSVLAKLKYDVESVKRYIVLGTCVSPPVFYAWYKWLDATFKARLPDGDSQILRLYAFGPSGLKDYGLATLCCQICHLATLFLKPSDLVVLRHAELRGKVHRSLHLAEHFHHSPECGLCHPELREQV